NSQLDVMIGNGDGTFQLGVVTGGGKPGELIAADINGDGHPDLINIGNFVRAYVNSGTGTFSSFNQVTTPTNSDGGAIADFNGDGKLDIAYAQRGIDQIGIALGNGDGTFKAGALQAAGDAPYDIVSGDVNGDGKLDLVTTSLYDNQVSIQFGNGD